MEPHRLVYLAFAGFLIFVVCYTAAMMGATRSVVNNVAYCQKVAHNPYFSSEEVNRCFRRP